MHEKKSEETDFLFKIFFQTNSNDIAGNSHSPFPIFGMAVGTNPLQNLKGILAPPITSVWENRSESLFFN